MIRPSESASLPALGVSSLALSLRRQGRRGRQTLLSRLGQTPLPKHSPTTCDYPSRELFRMWIWGNYDPYSFWIANYKADLGSTLLRLKSTIQIMNRLDQCCGDAVISTELAKLNYYVFGF
ncbi:hypothetical protein F5884DRAFT_750350 [Xylogone sp. PMI_703]|nr:hypothetical protein F5884DRAFT_750350 [Xylogone sp. PMI_703]